jgi:hypothetical protein
MDVEQKKTTRQSSRAMFHREFPRVFQADPHHYANITRIETGTPRAYCCLKNTHGQYLEYDRAALQGDTQVIGKTDAELGWHVAATPAHTLEKAAINGRYQEESLLIYVPGVGERRTPAVATIPNTKTPNGRLQPRQHRKKNRHEHRDHRRLQKTPAHKTGLPR